MNYTNGYITDEIRQMPFLKITVPFVVGILLAMHFELLWSIVFVIIITFVLLSFVFRNQVCKNCSILLMLVSLGFGSAQSARTIKRLPRGQLIETLIEVSEQPHLTTSRNRLAATAFVRAFRIRSDSAWQKTKESLVVYVDTTAKLSIGQMFSAKIYVNDFKDYNKSYSKLMFARGITGYTFVSDRLVGEWNLGSVSNIEYAARVLRNRVSSKLQQLLSDKEDAAVLAALLTGERSNLSQHTKQLYQRAGTSHILALSGMHLSMIFLILNILLKPVVLFGRSSSIVKTFVILCLIWTYSYMSGLSLSVCRAAIMITIAQLTLFSTTRGSRFNAIFIAAFLTLMLSPMALFDISFQLSYAAMLSILFFLPRFISWIRVPKYFGWLRSLCAVTVAAQIGVVPLVVSTFGSVSVSSLFINPIVALTTPLIMFFGAIGTFVPFCVDICEVIFDIHNSVIGVADNVEWGSINGITMSTNSLLLYYAVMLMVMLTIKLNQKWSYSNEKIFD